MSEFITAFKAIQKEVHQTAREKGWWRQRDAVTEKVCNYELENRTGLQDYAFAVLQTDLACAGLIITEIAEAMEGIRHGNPPDDKIPDFSSMEAEYADAIIRIMDHAEKRGWRIAEAIEAKMAMNKTRPPMHGKKA